MDELADRRQAIAAPSAGLSSGSAEEDRRLAAEDRRRAARYLWAAYRDGTTGALNRQPGREAVQLLVDRARRDGSALMVLFVDVDGLKAVNDSLGHDRGDVLLAAVGSALRSSLRSYDVVVRYGGDEFVCALPGGTAGVAAECVARAGVVLGELFAGATISVGCAELGSMDSVDEVIRRADADLYRGRVGRRPSAGRRLSAVPSPVSAACGPSVACGACAGRVPLADFVVELTARMTRSADCPACGAATLIQLSSASALPRGGWLPLGDG
jgi:diguanylate cyclase (GGDEF)-like protein